MITILSHSSPDSLMLDKEARAKPNLKQIDQHVARAFQLRGIWWHVASEPYFWVLAEPEILHSGPWLDGKGTPRRSGIGRRATVAWRSKIIIKGRRLKNFGGLK